MADIKHKLAFLTLKNIQQKHYHNYVLSETKELCRGGIGSAPRPLFGQTVKLKRVEKHLPKFSMTFEWERFALGGCPLPRTNHLQFYKSLFCPTLYNYRKKSLSFQDP